jgi:hypothetical protein
VPHRPGVLNHNSYNLFELIPFTMPLPQWFLSIFAANLDFKTLHITYSKFYMAAISQPAGPSC